MATQSGDIAVYDGEREDSTTTLPKERLHRVNTLPTSGYEVGGVYFVRSEGKIYIRTESAWECFDKASEADTASQATAIKVRASSATDDRPIPFSALGTASKTTLAPALDANFTYNKNTQTLNVLNVNSSTFKKYMPVHSTDVGYGSITSIYGSTGNGGIVLSFTDPLSNSFISASFTIITYINSDIASYKILVFGRRNSDSSFDAVNCKYTITGDTLNATLKVAFCKSVGNSNLGIYIGGLKDYATISLDEMLLSDGARNIDSSNVSFTIVQAEPTILQECTERKSSASSGGGSVTTDTSMSSTSTNPVQNKVIKSYVDSLVGTAITQLAQI